MNYFLGALRQANATCLSREWGVGKNHFYWFRCIVWMWKLLVFQGLIVFPRPHLQIF